MTWLIFYYKIAGPSQLLINPMVYVLVKLLYNGAFNNFLVMFRNMDR